MRSSILSVVHETAKDLADIGAISRSKMREFDVACFPVVVAVAPKGKSIRKLTQG